MLKCCLMICQTNAPKFQRSRICLFLLGTVDTQIKDMATDVIEQQTVVLKAANVFSVALDQSIDINNNSHLEVVVRYCSNDVVCEKLCCLKPKYGSTKGKDIPNTFMKNFEERGTDIKKIFSATIDGAPAMTGQHHGSLTLVEQKIGHPVMELHCIIHQKNLCVKISNSALYRPNVNCNKNSEFPCHILCYNTQTVSIFARRWKVHHDVPLLCSFRWLSVDKVLKRFVKCLVEIRTLLIGQGRTYPELEDEKWLVKLMFLADTVNFGYTRSAGISLISLL